MTLVMSLVTSALSGVGGQESSRLVPGVVSGQTLALGLLAGVSLPTVHRCVFVWLSFRKSFTVRARARAGDRYPLAGESNAAGGFLEAGALPSPWPALPREQSTCLPTDLCVEGMCRCMNKMIATIYAGNKSSLKSVWGKLLRCSHVWCRCGAVPCEVSPTSAAGLWLCSMQGPPNVGVERGMLEMLKSRWCSKL